MAVSSLVVRSGVGAWGAIKYVITRGLDIGDAVVDVVAAAQRLMMDASDPRIIQDATDLRIMLDESPGRSGRDGAV